MKKLLWILVSGFIGLSCSTSVEETSEASDISYLVGSDIKVIMLEELSETERTLKIRSETVEQQPCINFSLLTDYEVDNYKVVVNYKGIDKPEICLTAIGLATCEKNIVLGNGSYEVEFINSGISNEGQLVVDDEKYSLELFSPVNIIVEKAILYKIPKNTYWGVIGYHRESSVELVNDFIENLKEHVDFRQYENGDYGYFQISDGEIQAPANHGYWFAKPIIFEFEGDIDRLSQVIRQSIPAQKEELSISISSYSGENIHFSGT